MTTDMLVSVGIGAALERSFQGSGGGAVRQLSRLGKTIENTEAAQKEFTLRRERGTLAAGEAWRGSASAADRMRDLADRGEAHALVAGDGAPAFEIRGLFQDRALAEAAAEARLARMSRQTATLDMEVVGDPALVAETLVVTEGWGQGVDGEWTIVRATHALAPRTGYRTRLIAERAE